MHKPIRRLMLAGLIAAGLPLGLSAGTAVAASAAHAGTARSTAAVSPRTPTCVPSPYTGRCYSPTVQGTPWDSNGDNIRYAPTANSAREGGLPYGASTTVYCYAVGQYQSNPPWSDDYWDFVDYNGAYGFVSDAYLNTGGTITSQVYPCLSDLHGGN